jgi:uncharacterized protein YeaC (DUF1315 family)
LEVALVVRGQRDECLLQIELWFSQDNIAATAEDSTSSTSKRICLGSSKSSGLNAGL